MATLGLGHDAANVMGLDIFLLVQPQKEREIESERYMRREAQEALAAANKEYTLRAAGPNGTMLSTEATAFTFSKGRPAKPATIDLPGAPVHTPAPDAKVAAHTCAACLPRGKSPLTAALWRTC